MVRIISFRIVDEITTREDEETRGVDEVLDGTEVVTNRVGKKGHDSLSHLYDSLPQTWR